MVCNPVAVVWPVDLRSFIVCDKALPMVFHIHITVVASVSVFTFLFLVSLSFFVVFFFLSPFQCELLNYYLFLIPFVFPSRSIFFI